MYKHIRNGDIFRTSEKCEIRDPETKKPLKAVQTAWYRARQSGNGVFVVRRLRNPEKSRPVLSHIVDEKVSEAGLWCKREVGPLAVFDTSPGELYDKGKIIDVLPDSQSVNKKYFNSSIPDEEFRPVAYVSLSRLKDMFDVAAKALDFQKSEKKSFKWSAGWNIKHDKKMHLYVPDPAAFRAFRKLRDNVDRHIRTVENWPQSPAPPRHQ